MNNYLISIHSQPLSQILNGTQTIIILKRIPKELKNGEPCTFWGYCTVGKQFLYRPYGRPILLDKKVVSEDYFPPLLNGLVICKFVVEKVRRVVGYDYETDEYSKPFFEIHITSLEIIEPLPLTEFKKTSSKLVKGDKNGKGLKRSDKLVYTHEPLTKAPQSWCRVIPPKAEKEKEE